jgi:drug/metabolite transporter (DMT)-like permease
VRLATGALTLLLLLALRGTRPPAAFHEGSVGGALALFVYAAAFSFAYLRLSAGTGALLLFGSVQVTMIASGLARGERLRPLGALGFTAAGAGLVLLCLPGVTAPDPAGALLMVLAGVAWGVYSLLGRRAARPLVTTAGNFAWSVPLALLAAAAALPLARAAPLGILLAAASGALASGLGYSLWYAALPSLSALEAAVVQLAVPVLAAAGGVALLGETVTSRLVASSLLVLGGIAAALRKS